MSVITGKEAMFVNVKITQDELDLINRSPMLVDQLLKYNNDVLKEVVRPINSGGMTIRPMISSTHESLSEY
ncbi:hypothetical protein [Burkholderia ambifaria]|uniref:hypothetical protein n=1 Tax=Burkholderia ambifaria TaxID=152480 RepID=UPI00158D7316|nr:hypothetical protein [Burkholderia ambifaria]MBY4766283.1 hypothetical protein [Burkholderia ambifaria]